MGAGGNHRKFRSKKNRDVAGPGNAEIMGKNDSRQYFMGTESKSPTDGIEENSLQCLKPTRLFLY